MADAVDRLTAMFGFDPAKEMAAGNDVLKEALKEIGEERSKNAKTKAKEQLLKAIELRQQMAAKKREFENQYKKFEKELGKVLGQLDAMASGKSLEETETEEKEAASQ